MTLRSVAVVGSGLLGTSIGLALQRAGVEVRLSDTDAAQLRLAVDLGAGTPLDPAAPPADLAVLCVPPSAVAPALAAAQRAGLAASYTDVASVKSAPAAAAARLGCDLTTYAGGHPMAGRERAGAAAARADLFDGRAWVITPGPTTSPAAVSAATALARACGAVPVQMTAVEHDEAVAAVSHAPQLLASVLAGSLVDLPAAALGLAGQGLRDLTRIADSDPALWADIAAANAGPLSAVLAGLATRLAAVAAALADGPDRAALLATLGRGNAGRALLPGKHGGTAPTFAVVSVVVQDRPGQFARLLGDADAAGVNVEDLRVEHSPGHPVGLVELSVRPEGASALAVALEAAGWPVHPAPAAR